MMAETAPPQLPSGFKQSFDIKAFFAMFKKQFKLMLVIILISTAIGGAINYLLPDKYEAKTDMLVNETIKSGANSALSATEIETNLRLIETYRYILKSDLIVNKVNEQLRASYTKSELLKKVKIDSNVNSQIISVIAYEQKPEKAALLSNTFALTFQAEIKRLIKIENVHILNKATVGIDTKSVKPNTAIFYLLSAFIGLLLSMMVVIVREVYYTKLDSAQKTEMAMKVMNLGTIPFIKMKKGKMLNKETTDQFTRLMPQLGASSHIVEAFRTIRANLHFLMAKKSIKTILLTSSASGDGKSLISGNLAIILAMDNKKTVYVDADLRKANGRTLFNISKRIGITTYIEGTASVHEIIQKTETENLFFVGAGPIAPNPSELISTKKMTKLFEELREIFDVVIIDSPPLTVSDAIILSGLADGCIFIVNAKKTKQDQAILNIGQLRKVNAHMLGTILNKGKMPAGDGGYYY